MNTSEIDDKALRESMMRGLGTLRGVMRPSSQIPDDLVRQVRRRVLVLRQRKTYQRQSPDLDTDVVEALRQVLTTPLEDDIGNRK